MQLEKTQELVRHLTMTRDGRRILSREEDLTAWLDGQGVDVEQRAAMLAFGLDRLNQYARMIRHNVEDNLRGTYPLTFRLLAEEGNGLAEAFFLAHPARSYKLMENARPFAAFLTTQPVIERFPFLAQLARFEWAQSDLYNAKDVEPVLEMVAVLPESVGDLAALSPVPNPVAVVLSFDYPVHAITHRIRQADDLNPADFGSTPAEPVSLLIFRHPENLMIYFEPVSPLLAQWFDFISRPENRAESYASSLRKIALQNHVPEAMLDDFYRQFIQVLKPLLKSGSLCGSTQAAQ